MSVEVAIVGGISASTHMGDVFGVNSLLEDEAKAKAAALHAQRGWWLQKEAPGQYDRAVGDPRVTKSSLPDDVREVMEGGGKMEPTDDDFEPWGSWYAAR